MMRIEDLGLTLDNTCVFAAKRARKPKYGVGCSLICPLYEEYRYERRQSGIWLDDGWQLAMDPEVEEYILRLHGFTRETAQLSARAFTESVYGANYGRIARSHELILPEPGDTVETLARKYIERG